MRKGLALDPDLPDAWNTLGLLAHEQGRLGEAEAAFSKAISLRPDHWSVHNNLGNTFRAMGRLDAAAESFRTAVRLEPGSAAALTNLAQILIESGDLDLLDQAEELCGRALAHSPNLNEAINSLGNVYRLQGRLGDAMSTYQKALRLDPQRATTCLNMGKLLQEQGRYVDAAFWFDKAQSLRPNSLQYHLNLGSLSAARADFDEAARSYRLALAQAPDVAEGHEGLGTALLEQGRLDEAESSFKRAMEVDSSRPGPWTLMARLLAERGDFEGSCQAARHALTLRPNLVDAYAQLAFNLKGRLPDADIRAMDALLRHNHLPEVRRSLLLFGLAGVDDARGHYGASAARLETANALRLASRRARGDDHDPDHHSRFIDRIIATMTPDLIAHGRGWGDPDRRPVFVVGLPRSGTTLVEQIIASHPLVHAVGEIADVRRVFRSLPELVGKPFVEPCDALVALGPASARAAARSYLDRLDALRRRRRPGSWTRCPTISNYWA